MLDVVTATIFEQVAKPHQVAAVSGFGCLLGAVSRFGMAAHSRWRLWCLPLGAGDDVFREFAGADGRAAGKMRQPDSEAE